MVEPICWPLLNFAEKFRAREDEREFAIPPSADAAFNFCEGTGKFSVRALLPKEHKEAAKEMTKQAWV